MLEFYAGLAEILEIDVAKCNPEFKLDEGGADWDSLAVISTIALIDEIFNCTVSGQALSDCKTVGDLTKLIDNARV
jgi:acyl carrier protein